MPDIQIHPLQTFEALRRCEELQEAVWRYGEREIVPAAQMRAAQHAGALVAGAFVGREQVGFLYGFPALPHEPGLPGPGLHSHMLAVLPEARGLGLGRSLKWYQRTWCLRRGIRWVSWTFDPLQARNARLNAEHLGAVVHEYQVDFYGILGGQLSGRYPTDRFVALWWLEHERVARRAARDAAARLADPVGGPDAGAEAPLAAGADAPDGAPRGAAAAWALGRGGPVDAPGERRPDLDDDTVLVAAPRDINALRASDPATALAWREAYLAVVPPYLARGYEVRSFRGGAYALVRGRLEPPSDE